MLRLAAIAAIFGVALSLPMAASAHNRAHLILPSGECIIVGSEKSVHLPVSIAKSRTLPDGTIELDLRPETEDADEVGTAFAAEQGKSAIEKFGCP